MSKNEKSASGKGNEIMRMVTCDRKRATCAWKWEQRDEGKREVKDRAESVDKHGLKAPSSQNVMRASRIVG